MCFTILFFYCDGIHMRCSLITTFKCALSTFTSLCNHHYHRSAGLQSFYPANLGFHGTYTIAPPHPLPCGPLAIATVLAVCLILLGTHIGTATECLFFVWVISQSSVFKVHLYCNVYQNFFFFFFNKVNIIPLCVQTTVCLSTHLFGGI